MAGIFRLEWVRGCRQVLPVSRVICRIVKEVMSQPRRQKISGPKRPGFSS